MNSLPAGTDSPDTSSISLVNWRPGIDPKLSLEVLTRNLALLLKVFPTFQLDPDVAFDMLCDLTDAMLERSVLTLIQTKRDVYPSTAWLAEIRMTALEQRTSADDLTDGQQKRLKELGLR